MSFLPSRLYGPQYVPFAERESVAEFMSDLEPGSDFAQLNEIRSVGEALHYPEFFTVSVTWARDGEEQDVTFLVPQ